MTLSIDIPFRAILSRACTLFHLETLTPILLAPGVPDEGLQTQPTAIYSYNSTGRPPALCLNLLFPFLVFRAPKLPA